MRPTQPLHKSARRLALTTKQASTQYYKGNRTGSMGWHTKYGGYVIDLRKVRTYVPPKEPNHELTPFVSEHVKPLKSPAQLKKDAENRKSYYGQHSPKAYPEEDPDPRYYGIVGGERFLRMWKDNYAAQAPAGKSPNERVLLPGEEPSMEVMMKAGTRSRPLPER